MELAQLSTLKIAELNKKAKELKVEGYSGYPRKELVFKILEQQAKKDGLPIKEFDDKGSQHRSD